MGDYTRVGLVRSGGGFSLQHSPSGTVNFCIKRGESALRKYLRLSPATGSQTEAWVEDATTSFASYYLARRLASQDRGLSSPNRAELFDQQAKNAEDWWTSAIRICDMHGRDVIIETISP